MTAVFAGLPPPAGDAAATLPRLGARLPEPGHLWIRYAPRAWQGPERPWLDLATGRLGRSGGREAAAAASGADRESVATVSGTDRKTSAVSSGAGRRTAGAPSGAAVAAAGASPSAPPPDDLLYLPPVPAHLAGWRDRLAEHALSGGAPVLVQLLPGDPTALPPGGGAVVVIDLLAALLAGGGELAPGWLPPLPLADEAGERAPGWMPPLPLADGTGERVPGERIAVWPLVPGITDDAARWERSCALLAAAGFSRLLGLLPALGPGDRRRLAQALVGPGEESAFDALFHRQPAEAAGERELARVAHRHGLLPFLPRPLPRPPLTRAENRRIAGTLALAGELWLRLRRPVEQAQALFRAARWLDGTSYDVGALAREGNLQVVTALDPLARTAVAEAAAGGEPALLAELTAEYLAP